MAELLLRSVLYLPATNKRALEKAKTLPCDAVIVDLEDAVSVDAKNGARLPAQEASTEGDYGYRTLVLRINDIHGDWGEGDIAMLAESGFDAVLIPKIRSQHDVWHAIKMLDAAGVRETLPIWLMIETTDSILALKEIAGSSSRLEVLIFGSNDLLSEMGAAPTADRIALQYALTRTVLAGRANGLMVIDGVFNNFEEKMGFIEECTMGRILGFDGKSIIHPNQIEGANKHFAPTKDELAEAKAMIGAYSEAVKAGASVAVLNGQMVEELHVRVARRKLAQDKAIKERGKKPRPEKST